MTFFVSIAYDSIADVVGGYTFLKSLHKLLPATELTFVAEPALMMLHDHATDITLTTLTTTTYLFRQRQTKQLLAHLHAMVYIFDETFLSTGIMRDRLQLMSEYLPQQQLPWIWVVDNYDAVSITTPSLIHLPPQLNLPAITTIHRCCFLYDYGTLRVWDAICALAGGQHV